MRTNRGVWEDYAKRINTNFVRDFNALKLVFEILQHEMTRKEALIYFDKLVLIHQTVLDVEIENREPDGQR